MQRIAGKSTKFVSISQRTLLDSTLISLTLSVCDWAHYTATKGAVKMHTLLDYDCLLPEFVSVTDGKGPDNKAACDIPVNPYSIVAADRGYCDYSLLSHWDSNKVFFVVKNQFCNREGAIEVFFAKADVSAS